MKTWQFADIQVQFSTFEGCFYGPYTWLADRFFWVPPFLKKQNKLNDNPKLYIFLMFQATPVIWIRLLKIQISTQENLRLLFYQAITHTLVGEFIMIMMYLILIDAYTIFYDFKLCQM